jgi:hypothetical protein
MLLQAAVALGEHISRTFDGGAAAMVVVVASRVRSNPSVWLDSMREFEWPFNEWQPRPSALLSRFKMLPVKRKKKKNTGAASGSGKTMQAGSVVNEGKVICCCCVHVCM